MTCTHDGSNLNHTLLQYTSSSNDEVSFVMLLYVVKTVADVALRLARQSLQTPHNRLQITHTLFIIYSVKGFTHPYGYAYSEEHAVWCD